MDKYHKIQSIFKRDPATNHKTFLYGEYSLPEFEYLKDNIWIFTEKIDGTNIRVYFDGKDRVAFGGRTDNAQIPAPLYSVLSKKFTPDVFLTAGITHPMTLYGEGFGNKIQKAGKLYLPDSNDFILFDVLINGFWLNRDSVLDIGCELNVDVVPYITEGPLSHALHWCEDGFGSVFGNFQAEGLVLKPKTELKTRAGKRIITKVKCRDFIK